MKYLVLAPLLAILAACSTANVKQATQEPTIYIPKHPDLVLPDPVYTQVTLKDAKQLAAILQETLGNGGAEKHPDLAEFIGQAGTLYVNAHRAEIMDCSDKRGNKAGPGMADPDCLWVRPAADDWMGCMALQFSGEKVFQKFHLSTVRPDETMYIWIDRNYDTIVADPEGKDFLIKLNGLAKLGAACDALTKDEPPLGSIAV